MKATIDSRGEVRIVYNMQAEYLEAPGGLRYLPCDGKCGRLLKVAPNVVATECPECHAAYTDPGAELGPSSSSAAIESCVVRAGPLQPGQLSGVRLTATKGQTRTTTARRPTMELTVIIKCNKCGTNKTVQVPDSIPYCPNCGKSITPSEIEPNIIDKPA